MNAVIWLLLNLLFTNILNIIIFSFSTTSLSMFGKPSAREVELEKQVNLLSTMVESKEQRLNTLNQVQYDANLMRRQVISNLHQPFQL